jgi:hypothetical protein
MGEWMAENLNGREIGTGFLNSPEKIYRHKSEEEKKRHC